MPIMTPHVDTYIAPQQYASPAEAAMRQANLEALLKGKEAASAMARLQQTGEQEKEQIGLKGQQTQEQDKLQALLKGQNEEKQARLKQQLDIESRNQERESNLQAIDQLKSRFGQDAQMKAGNLEAGKSPYAGVMAHNQKNSEQALAGAKKLYEGNVKQMNDEVDAIQTGLNALKNNDNTSVGQLRAAILSANGFKRFNEPEAIANAPDSVKQQISGVLNRFGVPTEGTGNLTDIQRQNATKFFQGKADEIQDRHNTMKGAALDSYRASLYYDPSGEAKLKGNLGIAVDDRLRTMKHGLDDFHRDLGTAPKPVTGGGFLQHVLGTTPSANASQVNAPPSTPPGPGLPQAGQGAQSGGFDPDSYLKGQ